MIGRRRRILNVGLSALLAFSLSAKVAVMSRDLPEPRSDPETPIVAALAAAGFGVDFRPGTAVPRVVVARSGSCRLRVMIATPGGWDRDLIRQLAKPGDRIAFLFRGAFYSDQPLIRTALDHYWARVRRSVGIGAMPHTILAMIASSGCDIGSIDWPMAVGET